MKRSHLLKLTIFDNEAYEKKSSIKADLTIFDNEAYEKKSSIKTDHF